MTATVRRLIGAARTAPAPSSPLVDQLIAAGVSSTDIYAYGLRKLKSTATASVQARRSSDNALLDIGFDGQNNMDIAGLMGHIGAGTGAYAAQVYDQSGNTAVMTTTSNARQLQLFATTTLRTAGSKPRPAMYVTATDSGYTATLPSTFSGSSCSAFLVAQMSNATTSSLPRFAGLLDASSTADAVGATRALLIARNGSSTPANTWCTDRNGVITSIAGDGYNTLDQVVTIFDGTNVNIYLNNGTPTTAAATGAFSVTRLSMGKGGDTAGFIMAAQSMICELIFLRVAASSTIRNLIHTDQAAYYGVP